MPLAIGGALGGLNGLLVVYGKVSLLIAALGTMSVYRGITYVYARRPHHCRAGVVLATNYHVRNGVRSRMAPAPACRPRPSRRVCQTRSMTPILRASFSTTSPKL